MGSSTSTDTTGVNHGHTGGATVTSGNSPIISESKDSNKNVNTQGEGEVLTFRDGTPIPVDENGEVDLSSMDAEHAAEWYIDNLGADAKEVVDRNVAEAKKALDDAMEMKIDGRRPSEMKASADAKRAAVEAAQRNYDRAKAVADVFAAVDVRLDGETPEGRKGMVERAIDKARRKMRRAQSVAEKSKIWQDTVLPVLQSLYGSTSVDVTDMTPQTLDEYVASGIGPHSLNYEGKDLGNGMEGGVKQELGISRGIGRGFDTNNFNYLIAKKGEGKTIPELAHELWQDSPEHLREYTDQDMRNTLLDLLQSADSSSYITDYVLNRRIEQAEKEIEGEAAAVDNAKHAAQNTDETQTAAAGTESLPFEARPENEAVPFSKSKERDRRDEPEYKYDHSTKEGRQRLIDETAIDETDIPDEVMPEPLRKAIAKIAKTMGVKVQYLNTDDFGANGFVQGGVIYLSVSPEKAVPFVFGHEMTHKVREMSEDAYQNLKTLARSLVNPWEWHGRMAMVSHVYRDEAGYDTDDSFEEEVVADILGDTINDTNMLDRLATGLADGKKTKSETFMDKILGAVKAVKEFFNGVDYYEQRIDNIAKRIEQAYREAKSYAGSHDNQGNPINKDGSLIIESVNSVNEITDGDFTNPTRTIELPKVPRRIADALGLGEKSVIIKKNIFDRNRVKHPDVTPEQCREILSEALYNTNLYGQNQKQSRPYNWVLIKTGDSNHSSVLLEIEPKKDNAEIVHWYFLRDTSLEQVKRQAIREGGQLLILPSENSEEVGGLSNLTNGLSSSANVANSSGTSKEIAKKSLRTNDRQEIIRSAKEDGTYLKTPNGEVSELTPEQWADVRTDNFKEFFGDWENDPENASMMVDENGEPKVFYHNTDNSFTTFDEKRNGSHTDSGWLGDGFYFYGDKNEGSGYGKNKMAVYLDIRNPYYATAEDVERLSEANSREESVAFRQELEDEGYDGVYYNGDLRQEAVAFHPNQIKSATDNNGNYSKEENDIRYSLRQKPAPKNTIKVYKLMRLGEDGRSVMPLYIGSSERLEMGKWYDADSPALKDLKLLPSGSHIVDNTTGEAVSIEDFKTEHPEFSKMGGKPNVKAVNWATANNSRWILIKDKNRGQSRYGGEKRSYYNYGINGSGAVGEFAMRPGWHAGSLPTMRQIGKGKEKNLRDDDFVWVEGEMSADKDYNAEAQKNADRDIPDRIPEDGFYMKSTNANAKAAQADKVGWYVSGSFKPLRFMSDAEADAVVDKWNEEHPDTEPVEKDWRRESGKVFNAETMQLEDAPQARYSLRTYHGTSADFDRFDNSHMGEGEGNQSYGWGTYVTGVEGIGRYYATTIARKRTGASEYEEIVRKLSLGEIQRNRLLEILNNYERVIKHNKEILANDDIDERQKEKAKKIIKRAENNIPIDQQRLDEVKREIDGYKDWIEKNPLKVPTRHLYEVDIPDDTGSNYLDWDTKLKRRTVNMVAKAIDADVEKKDRLVSLTSHLPSDRDSHARLDYTLTNMSSTVKGYTGHDLYDILHMLLGSDKEASMFLSDLGFVGIRYPADYRSGGREDGAKNYVIFNEADAQIVNHVKFSKRLDEAKRQTETEPTEAQKESGNYRKGHIKFGGYDYTIENPAGSFRRGIDADGHEWRQKMHATYGYIRGKWGKDGDHLDMFINDKADLDDWNGNVYVVDQVNKDGTFDEHKVMYGYDTEEEARKAYLANYEKGWQGLGAITGVSKADFDKWLDSSKRKMKPFSEHSVAREADKMPETFDEFLQSPIVKFSIKTPTQRKAAEDAYNYASENRPDKYSRYALVDMDAYGKAPEYMEKKAAADNWRRYYNKLKWGNYKLFDLDKPFEENVRNLVGEFPDKFGNSPRLGNAEAQGGEVRFSKRGDTHRSLVGVHNISEEKLLKALKLGGLANPSVAVIDSYRQAHSGFGDISLIMPSDKIAKRTGKNAGTFFGDAWTPTYPQVERQFGKGGSEKAARDINSVPKEMQRMTRNAVDSWLDGRDADGLAYLYLQEKGKAPDLVRMEGKYGARLHKAMNEITHGEGLYKLDEDGRKKVLGLLIDEKYGGDRKAYEEDMARLTQKQHEILSKMKNPKAMLARRIKEDLDWREEHGYDYGMLSKFVDEVSRDAKSAGEVSDSQTMLKAQQTIEKNGLKQDFERWKDGLAERYGVKEVIFDGFTPSGNRRYVPNDLEHVSRIMKKQGLAGASGSGFAFNQFAATIMEKTGSLSELRKRKDMLTENHADMDVFTEEWGKVYNELADAMNPNPSGFLDDAGYYRLAEAALQSDPKAYAKKEYGVDLTDRQVEGIRALVNAIRKERPTMYFETKFERPVGLDEFTAAVVPGSLSETARQGLERAGLRLYEYDPKTEGDRRRAFQEATSENEERVKFSLIGKRGAAALDHAEEVSCRMDNLDVARQMETEKKDAKAIKIATGWERGADGKWRYEIPDVQIKPDVQIDRDTANTKVMGKNESLSIGCLSDFVKGDNLFKAYPWLEDVNVVIYKGNDRTRAYYSPMLGTIAISADLLESVKTPVKNWEEINMQLAYANGLYDNLNEVEKEHADELIDNFGGYTEEEMKSDSIFQRVEKEMPKVAEYLTAHANIPVQEGGAIVGYKLKDNDYVRGVLGHEIQHAIQRIEGFATGGSVDTVRKRIQEVIDEEQDASDYAKEKLKEWAYLKYAAQRLDDFYRNGINSSDAVLKNMAVETYWDAMNELNNNPDSRLVNDYPDGTAEEIAESGYHVEEAKEELRRMAQEVYDNVPKGNMESLELVEKLENALKYKDAYELYRSLSGEVEARNVQKRMSMSPEERRQSLAAETEDVAREDQIFLYGNGGTAMSFGEPYDYERYPRGKAEPGLAEKKVKIVEADAEHGFKNYREAKEWAKNNIVRTYSDDETGGKGYIRISNTAIDKFLSQSSVDKSDGNDVHMIVLKVLPKVLKESIDAETHPDFLKGINGKRSDKNGINRDVLVHRCYGAVRVWDNVYRVKITLKENAQNSNLPTKAYNYEATKIELLTGTLGKPYGDAPRASNSISGANLLKDVEMSYDKGKKLLDESEKNGIEAYPRRRNAAARGEEAARFSLRNRSDNYDERLAAWKERNGLAEDAEPMEKPQQMEGESAMDFMSRIVEWTKDKNLWKTAPKPMGYWEALEDWKQEHGIPADEFPPTRPRRQDYETEEEYDRAIDQYNREREKWQAPQYPNEADYPDEIEFRKAVERWRREKEEWTD